MEKIGIITLNGYYNYGNRLQNYALQEILKKYDYKVETIWVNNNRIINQNPNKLKKLIQIITMPKTIINKTKYELFYKKNYLERVNKFKQFSDKYIHETPYKISEDHLPNDKLNEFTYFVTGSDQVWNPHFMKGSPLYFLTFAPIEKRIAYAPSFGVSEIPTAYIKEYTKWLNDMSHISVREDAGAKIVSELTGRSSVVVADPTMLLSKENWLEIAKPSPKKPKGDFLLTYYLGKLPLETKRFIQNHAKKFNLKVINLAQINDKEFYLTDPAEFLDFINSAKLFVTDSFHGAVFSILFETPFVITDRLGSVPSMNSRINTLLSKFALEDRHILNIKEENVLNPDFSHVDNILEKERLTALSYLETALKR